MQRAHPFAPLPRLGCLHPVAAERGVTHLIARAPPPAARSVDFQLVIVWRDRAPLDDRQRRVALASATDASNPEVTPDHLLAALLRRDRLQAVQQLDRAIAGDLHPYSQAWQRAESLRLLQAQSAALPALVDRLQAMTSTFEQHSAAANERLLAGQEAKIGSKKKA